MTTKPVEHYKKHGYSVSNVCEVLKIARSSYYKHKVKCKAENEKQDELLCCFIEEYHTTYDGILVQRRMPMLINRLNQRNLQKGTSID